jgi:hypothetical protein
VVVQVLEAQADLGHGTAALGIAAAVDAQRPGRDD